MCVYQSHTLNWCAGARPRVPCDMRWRQHVGALARSPSVCSSSGSDMRRHGCMFLTFTRFVGLTGALSPHIMRVVAAAHFAGCDDDDFRFIGVELVGVCECVWFFFVYSMCVRKCIRRVSAVMWCMPKTNPDGNQQQKRRVCVCVGSCPPDTEVSII